MVRKLLRTLARVACALLVWMVPAAGALVSSGAAQARLPIPRIEALLDQAIDLAEAQRQQDAVALLDQAWLGLPPLPAEAALRGRLAGWRGGLLLHLGHHAEAERALTDALLATRSAHGDGGVELARVQATLAEASRRRDRVDEAIAWLRAARSSLDALPPGSEGELRARIANALAVLLWREGAREEAAALLDESAAMHPVDDRGVVAENLAAATTALQADGTPPDDARSQAAKPLD